MTHFVYYVLGKNSGDLLYIGRSKRPHERLLAFIRRTGVTDVELGISQRHGTLVAASIAELQAITATWPPFNKILTSSKGREGITGHQLSHETRRRMSKAGHGRPKPLEWRLRMSEMAKGRQVSLEARAKISATKKAQAAANRRTSTW